MSVEITSPQVVNLTPKKDVALNLDNDVIVAKYISYFCKKETDDQEEIFPGKPQNVFKKMIGKNVVIYCFGLKFYRKFNGKIILYRDYNISATISKNTDVYKLDIKFIDNNSKSKQQQPVPSILIKKPQIISILDSVFA